MSLNLLTTKTPYKGMKKNCTKSLSFAFLLMSSTFTFISCKEQALEEVKPDKVAIEEVNPLIEDGRMKFNSLKDFSTFMKQTKDKSIKELKEMSKALNFNSHLRVSTDIITNETNAAKEDSLKSIITDPYFSSVLNDKKEIEFGNDVIYRAGNDYCFMYQNGQGNLIEDFYKDLQSQATKIQDGKTFIYKNNLVVFNTFFKKPKSNKSSKVAGVFQDVVDNYIDWGDGQHRMYSQIWDGNWLVYSSSGIKTEAEEYGWQWLFKHGWNNADAQTITVSAQANLRAPSTTQPGQYVYYNVIYPTITETDCHRAIRRFDYSTLTLSYGGTGTFNFTLGSVLLNLKNFSATDVAGNTLEIVSVVSNHSATMNNITRYDNLYWLQ